MRYNCRYWKWRTYWWSCQDGSAGSFSEEIVSSISTMQRARYSNRVSCCRHPPGKTRLKKVKRRRKSANDAHANHATPKKTKKKKKRNPRTVFYFIHANLHAYTQSDIYITSCVHWDHLTMFIIHWSCERVKRGKQMSTDNRVIFCLNDLIVSLFISATIVAFLLGTSSTTGIDRLRVSAL